MEWSSANEPDADPGVWPPLPGSRGMPRRGSAASPYYQRITLSPPRTGASRLSTPRSGIDAWQIGAQGPTGRGEHTAGSRDGYLYQFSPEPLTSPRRGWSPPQRTGRGWSQFSGYADMRAARSPSPPPAGDFKHPVNPDVTPQHFWTFLSDLRARKTPPPQAASWSVLPTVLPQIVPKLKLSNLPSPSSGMDIPVSSAVQTGLPQAPKQDAVRRRGKGPTAGRNAARLGSGLRTPGSDMRPPKANGRRQEMGDEEEAVSAPEKRRIVATYDEVMGLQHRKLGINPRGRIWDLRGRLNADDTTLQVTQVAAAVLGNPNLEILETRGNGLDGTCGTILAAVLANHTRIETFCGIPVRRIKEGRMKSITLRADPTAEQDSSDDEDATETAMPGLKWKIVGTGKVHVKVFCIGNFASTSGYHDTTDPFVQVSLRNECFRSKVAVNAGGEADFMETFSFSSDSSDLRMNVQVYDQDQASSDLLGENSIDLAELCFSESLGDLMDLRTGERFEMSLDGEVVGFVDLAFAADKPSGGNMVRNDRLSTALQHQTEFTSDELMLLGGTDLSFDSILLAGHHYFQPVDTAAQDAAAAKFRSFNPSEELQALQTKVAGKAQEARRREEESVRKGGGAYGPAEVAVLGTLLIDTSFVEKLDLLGAEVGKEAFVTLGVALRTHTRLVHLDLGRTGMYTENFEDLMPGLKNCSALLQLHLGTNFLEARAMQSLSCLLDQALTSLRVLDVRNNLIGHDGATVLGPAILQEHLTDVNISNNRIGASGCEAFVKCLGGENSNRVENLTSLNLAFNGMDMEGALELISKLNSMRNLRSLRIHCDIPISDLRVKGELFLTGMGFGDIEGVVVAHVLRLNVNLRALDLRGNELGDISRQALGSVLVSLPQLRLLNQIPLSDDVQAADVVRILRSGMQVTYRTKTPVHPKQMFSFETLARKLTHTLGEEKKSALDDDEDHYTHAFKDWKKGGVRPETAAISEGGSDSDSDVDRDRPHKVGFYGPGRNARLRRRARPPPQKEDPTATNVLERRLQKINGNLGSGVTEGFRPLDSAAIVETSHHTSQGSGTSSVHISSPLTGVASSFRRAPPAMCIDIGPDGRTGMKSNVHVKTGNTSPPSSPLNPRTSPLPSPQMKRKTSFSPLNSVKANSHAPLGRMMRFKIKMAGAMAKGMDSEMAYNLSNNRTCHHSGSQMGPDGARSLAEDLKTKPAKLSSVDLSLSRLTGLDRDSRGQIDLHGLKALCRVLKKNTGIMTLNLAWNYLGAGAMPMVKTVLEANQSLTHLDLYKNSISEDGVKILVECIELLPCLRELNLRYNNLGPGGAGTFSAVLPTMTSLIRLDIAGNAFGHAGLKILVPALTRATQLTCIFLNENEGGVKGNQALVEYVVNSSKNLAELNGLSINDLLPLPDRKLPTSFENYEALYLAGEFSGATSIRSWNLYTALSGSLDRVNLSCCALHEFPDTILYLTSLSHLDVSHNRLWKIPVAQICALTSLTELECSDNYNLCNPPPEIAQQGGKTSIFYLKEMCHSVLRDDEVALIAIGAQGVGKSSVLSCMVTGAGRNTAKKQYSTDGEFADGTPLFHGEPIFDAALLDNFGGLGDDSYSLNISDRDDACLTGPEGTIVCNTLYWRAENKWHFLLHDLPGHPFYAATNRLFFRRRAIYLLVWEIKDYPSEEAMHRGMVSICEDVTLLMDSVQSAYPGAFCLAVATHADVTMKSIKGKTKKAEEVINRPAEQQNAIMAKAIKQKIETMKIQSSSGSCLHVFNEGFSSILSCTQGDGVLALRRDIVTFASSLDAFKTLLPKPYLRLRNCLRLIRNRRTMFDWDTYAQFASLCGLEGRALKVATHLLQHRGYLTFESVETAYSSNRDRGHLTRLKVVAQTSAALHVTLAQLPPRDGETKTDPVFDKMVDQVKEDKPIVFVSPPWLIRVLRGLFNPDIELLIEWFNGTRKDGLNNFALLRAAFKYLTTGILERGLVYYLWPGLPKSFHEAFWQAYADRGVGPVRSQEGRLACRESDYDNILGVLEKLNVIRRLSKRNFWVPCMQTGACVTRPCISDARVFKQFRRGVSTQIRFNFLPPDFFQTLVSLCSDIKCKLSNDSLDRIDYSSRASLLYLKGDRARLSIYHAPRSPYHVLSLNATTSSLFQELQDKLTLAECMYPGMKRYVDGEADVTLRTENVANIRFLFSLHATPHANLLEGEVQKYDVAYKIEAEQVTQLSRILMSLSMHARDMLRCRHVNTIGKLRRLVSYDSVPSREKMVGLGFSDEDAKMILECLIRPTFEGQVVILCLDELYSDESECDWYAVIKHVQAGAYAILVLLPGFQKVDAMPILPISVVDLRTANWIQEGCGVLLSFQARQDLKGRLQPLLNKLVKQWRSVPHVDSDFDRPPVPCHECMLRGEFVRQRFNVDAKAHTHEKYISQCLRSGESLDEGLVHCVNNHGTTMEDILTTRGNMMASACPECVMNGTPVPHCFSRQSCLDVLHGRKTFVSQDGADGEDAPGAQQKGPILSCPRCRATPDFFDVMQAECFVSHNRRKVKCISCGKSSIVRSTEINPKLYKRAVQQEAPRADDNADAERGARIVPNLLSRTQSIPKSARAESNLPSRTQSIPKSSVDIGRLAGNNADADFCCQDCRLIFGSGDIDDKIACLQRVIGYVEEHLDVLAVKSSILYDNADMRFPMGGSVALRAAKSANVFIAFMDSSYIKSQACVAEFAAAVQAKRFIVPVLLPGYVSTGSKWYSNDIKYKRSDGIFMVAPFSALENFTPITVEVDDDGSGRDSKLAWALLSAVSSYLHGGVGIQQRTQQAYEEWQKEIAAQRTSLLGIWAKLEAEEAERKIARIWRRHAGSLTTINKMKQQLGALGIKCSDLECTTALTEVSGNLKTMGPVEFRQFMWNILSNVALKADSIARHR